MRNILSSALFFSVAIVLTAFLAFIKAGEHIKNQAVSDCMKNSIIQWKNPDNSGYTMMDNWMNMCMQKKGYK